MTPLDRSGSQGMSVSLMSGPPAGGPPPGYYGGPPQDPWYGYQSPADPYLGRDPQDPWTTPPQDPWANQPQDPWATASQDPYAAGYPGQDPYASGPGAWYGQPPPPGWVPPTAPPPPARKRGGSTGAVVVGWSKANVGGFTYDPGAVDISAAMPFLTTGPDRLALKLDSTFPQLGTNFTLTTSNVPPVVPLAIVFFGDTQLPGIDLAFIGAPLGASQTISGFPPSSGAVP